MKNIQLMPANPSRSVQVYEIKLLRMVNRFFFLGIALCLRDLLILRRYGKAWQMYPKYLQRTADEKPDNDNCDIEPESGIEKAVRIDAYSVGKAEDPRRISNVLL